MKWFWKILRIGIVVYLLLCVFIYLMQPGMIFYPDIPGRELKITPKSIGLDYDDVELITSDQVKLHGWFIPANMADPKSIQTKDTLLFFHGNAGNISHRLDSIKLFHRLNLNVFIIDYRGYGRSEGKISEAGTYQDAEAAWRHLTHARGIAANTIIIFGRSLGGAVAAWLAGRHTPAALIVESSFSSVESMGKRFYPFLPVKLLSRFQYDTRRYVKDIQCPVLIAHSRDDEIIPYEEGLAIFKAASQPKQLLVMQGGHNNGFIVSGVDYVNGLDTFIQSSLRE